MKAPQSEPYQRSRHRAALHAWVVAATAVASIGMPSLAVALPRDQEAAHVQHDALTPAQQAKRVAADWLAALKRGEVSSALSATRMPGDAQNERDAVDEMSALSDWLAQERPEVRPLAVEQAGHWALSAWCLGEEAMVEPIALYHPASDGVDTSAGDWQVVPQGFESDPALAPLYNADYDGLVRWYQSLRWTGS